MSETEMKSGESDWTAENLLKLFAALKSAIPKRYSRSVYSRGLKQVDWDEVAFPPFSPEACRTKWAMVLSKIRKTRTLTEIIDEAEDTFSRSAPSSKIHLEFLKKPIPPSAIFYEENRAKFHEQYPELSNQKLFQFVAKKYKTLSSEEKAQYVEKYKLASKEYTKRKMVHKPKRKKDCADTPDEGEKNTKAAKSLPPKPPFNGYQLFCKEQMSSMAGVPNRSYVTVWAQRWRDLTESQRDEYRTCCSTLKKKYATELNEFLNTLDEEEQQQILKENGIKRPKVQKHSREAKLVKTFPGEPKMPSRSSNVIFCQNQLKLLKDKFRNPKECLIKVNKMWRDLPIKEREVYKQQLVERFRNYSLELQEWFKTLTAEEQEDYLTQNPRKRQYLDAIKTKIYKKEEQGLYRPSDSEDEVISSSEEEEDNLDCDEEQEEEEEEEEEDGDIAFEMY